MKTLLQIDTSLYSGEGRSSQLASAFTAAWQAAHPDGQIIRRDLTRDPVPHLTAETFAAYAARPETRTAAQRQAVADSDRMIEELKVAQVIVLAVPMYNFGIPSTLKAYFDHVARASVSFRYTENGPQGLLTGKQVIVVSTRGGEYAGTPLDVETDYLRMFLRFLGMEDVHFVYAEGLARSGSSHTAFAHALARAQALAAPVAQAA